MLRKKMALFTATPLAIALLAGPGALLADDDEGGLSDIERLGKKIFFDTQLSIRRNQSCATCHVPAAGWTGDDSKINEHGAVYEGSIKGEFGNRKPPSSAYASVAPIFYADFGNRLLGDNDVELEFDPLFVGGNFWDGRATGWELGNPAADQAQGPFLNPVEQALPDTACVVYRVCEGKYGELFDKVWNPNFCKVNWPREINRLCTQTTWPDPDPLAKQRNKIEQAYDRVALSVAAYEDSAESNAFTSKIDAHRAGLYEFTAQEELGRQIFRGKGLCSACHVGTPGPGAPPPLFTDFTYDNLGVPKNPENPFTIDNPDWADPGLAGFLENVSGFAIYAPDNLGKQKVPTLRNVGLGSCEALEYADDDEDGDDEKHGKKCITKAYMHNGFFKSLKTVVNFYNTRDVKPRCESLDPPVLDATEEEALANDCWPAPEVDGDTVNTDELGNLGLTEEEELALVAFMMAMSDGYLEKDDDDEDDD
jgi:cytochrome c peroxidase